MGGPAVRASHARNEEQRVGEDHGYGGGRAADDEQECKFPRLRRHPDRDCKKRIIDEPDRGIGDSSEEAGSRRLHDAASLQFSPLRSLRLPLHENRGVETNSAEHCDDRSDQQVTPRLKQTVKRIAGFGLLIASFALAVFVIHYQPEVEHEIRSIGPLAYPLAIVIFALVASAPFSVTDALAIMNGAIFGPVYGSIVNAVGLVFAALLGYWINRHASHMLDLDQYLARLPSWVRQFKIGSPAFLLSVRVIPGFGGTVATATAAAFRIPVWVHVWTMCAIAIPICTLLAIFGDRVTVAVQSYEHRMGVYLQHHHPHFHFRRRPKAAPTP